MLNDIVINLCTSKQYQKAIETKSQNDINHHVKKFLETMTELIYNNLNV